MNFEIPFKRILYTLLFVTLVINFNNELSCAQTSIETQTPKDTVSLSWINEVLDSAEGLISAIAGLLMLIGGIIYLIVTKAKILVDIFLRWFRSSQKLNEPVFYDNYETIIKYLKSENWDQYNTAFTYILHHKEFPKNVIRVLTKIILKEKPFNGRDWITDKERIKASQHLCFVLKKNVQKLNGHDGINFCNVDTMLKSNTNPG